METFIVISGLTVNDLRGLTLVHIGKEHGDLTGLAQLWQAR